MSTNSPSAWFSKASPAPGKVSDSIAATVQNQQPTSPKTLSINDAIFQQTNSQPNAMKLRGGGGKEICCGLCAGLLCFECCECCEGCCGECC